MRRFRSSAPPVLALAAALSMSVLGIGCEGRDASAVSLRRSELVREPAPLSDEAKAQFARGNLDLSLDLLRSLNPSSDENFAVSALSVQTAFGMVHAMSRGETQAQISQGLNLPQDPALAQASLKATDLALLSRNLEASPGDAPVVFSTANRVVMTPRLEPGQTFLDTLAQNYDTGIYHADFANESGKILRELNDWVDAQTHGRIRNLLTGREVHPATDWVLINAIYLKAPWDFSKAGIQKRPFFRKDGSTAELDFVSVPYTDGRSGSLEGLTWAQVPLRDQKLSMLFIVPDQGRFDEVRAGLSGQGVQTMLRASQGFGGFKLKFPKFKIEKDRMELSPILSQRGMNAVFSQPDFSGFSEQGPQPGPASLVLQSVFVAADEEGVEAAAATAMAQPSSGPPDSPVNVEINRPFLFLIYDAPTGVALFAGQVLDPTS